MYTFHEVRKIEREKIETERDSGRGFDRRGIKEDQIRD